MKHVLFIACLGLAGCTGTILGLTPGQRFGLYGTALAAAGHPELAGPVVIIGSGLDKQARKVSPSGK